MVYNADGVDYMHEKGRTINVEWPTCIRNGWAFTANFMYWCGPPVDVPSSPAGRALDLGTLGNAAVLSKSGPYMCERSCTPPRSALPAERNAPF